MTLWPQLANLSEPMKDYLIGAAGDGTGGLISGFARSLLRTAGSRVGKNFTSQERQLALQRAVAAAFAAALDEWATTPDEAAHYQDLFSQWLLKEAVLGEFKQLLAPKAGQTLDLELLEEEFEALGLSIVHLGKVSFPVLIADMVGAFYKAAAEERSFEGVLNTGFLREIAASLGALERTGQAQVKASRQAVDHLEAIRQLVEQIAASNGKPSPEQLALLEAHYRQTIINQFKWLTFQGLSPSGVPISLPLEEIYVELKAVADVPEAADTYSAEERRLLLEAEGRGNRSREEVALQLDALRAERWNRQARQEQQRFQRRSIQETLDDPLQRGVVILGDPGSGKTTLLQYQALRAAWLSGPTALLPIFVPLAAYDDFLRREPSNRSLGFFLAAYYERWRELPGLAPLFEQALTQGRALVLFDGLDEVLDTTTRQFVAEQAGALIRQWASRGNRFALSSRIVGYREARLPGDLPHVTVLDFGRAEIERFARQWCLTYEIWLAKGDDTSATRQKAAAEEHDLLEEVRSNASVERLAASPLLLTMLALLRRHVGRLPDQRIELYERYIRTLVDNWRTYRSPGARQHEAPRSDPHLTIAHLIQLALWLQQNKPSGTVRRQELEDELEAICLRYEGHDPITATEKARVEARQSATGFLQEMRAFAGLLAERGRDAFGFFHLTFQEYFCGRALARMKPEERWSVIQPYLHHPRWREPILLCAGQLGVMEQRQDEVSELATRILQAGSEHDTILHRDLFLTAALAADDVGLNNTTLDTLTERLTALQTSAIPTVRDTALTGFAHLARIGHQPAVAILEHTLNSDLQIYVMRALRSVIGAESYASLRAAITAKLDDERYDVQPAAIGALASLVGSDVGIRAAITTKLDDERYPVRQAAIGALAGLTYEDIDLRHRLVFWLGTAGQSYGPGTDSGYGTRRLLAKIYGPLLVQDKVLFSQVVAMLSSPAWPMRQGAALALIAMPDGPPSHLLPTLRSLLEDQRGEESWPERLQATEVFLNARDTELSRHAIALAVEALDYATQPWYGIPHEGAQVRQTAAGILGQLDPLYRDEAIFTRLARLMEEDENAEVRDAAYSALLRLAAAPEVVGGK